MFTNSGAIVLLGRLMTFETLTLEMKKKMNVKCDILT